MLKKNAKGCLVAHGEKTPQTFFSEIEQRMMARALVLATKAADDNNVPVGAVVWEGDELIAEGYNQTISNNDTTAHAEIIALREANQKRQNYRLPHCKIAVTLEPCPMCLGAIFQARFDTLIFAAQDPKSGACGGVIDLSSYPLLNHHTVIRGGLYADAAAKLLRDFFRQRR